MAASFVLTLDTAAPQIAWGDLRFNREAGFIEQDYTLDEPGIISAVFIDGFAREWPVTVTPTKLIVNTEPTYFWSYGTLTLQLRDDVMNERVVERHIFDVLPVTIEHDDFALWETAVTDFARWETEIEHDLNEPVSPHVTEVSDEATSTLELEDYALHAVELETELLP